MIWFILTCMIWFIHQNVLLIISTWQWANCSIFVIVICPLLPPQLCTGRRRRWWRGAGWWLWSPAHLSPSSSCSSPSGRTWCSSQWRGRSWTCWAGLYRRGTRGSAGGGRLTEYSRTQEPGTKYKYQEQLNENTVQHLSYKGGVWCYTAGIDIILTKINWKFILSDKTVPPVCFYWLILSRLIYTHRCNIYFYYNI